jgi:two-component system CheB/CheR fusion protein
MQPHYFQRPPFVINENSPRHAASPDSSPLKRVDGFKVLVVDDVSDNLAVCSFVLKKAGYTTVGVSSAGEAIDAAKKTRFDMVLSDIGMGEMDGYELARQLRALPGYATTPFIAVTGFAEYEDHQLAFRAGFNAHLKKPLDPAKLLEIVARLTP